MPSRISIALLLFAALLTCAAAGARAADDHGSRDGVLSVNNRSATYEDEGRGTRTSSSYLQINSNGRRRQQAEQPAPAPSRPFSFIETINNNDDDDVAPHPSVFHVGVGHPIGRKGLSIGLERGGVDIYRDGQAQPGWGLAEPSIVTAPEHKTRFWIELTTEGDVEALSGVDVTVGSPGVVSVVSKRSADLVKDTHSPTVLTLGYECHSRGSSTVSLSLHLSDAFTRPSWSFVKECTDERRPGLGISLTEAPLRTDVANDGEGMWTQETAVSRIVPFTTFELPLYLTLDTPGGHDREQTIDAFQANIKTLSDRQSDTISPSELSSWRSLLLVGQREARRLQQQGVWWRPWWLSYQADGAAHEAPSQSQLQDFYLQQRLNTDVNSLQQMTMTMHPGGSAVPFIPLHHGRRLGAGATLTHDGGEEAYTPTYAPTATPTSATMPSILAIRYGGALQDGGVLEEGSVKDVTLTFECLRPGTALVELKVSPAPVYQPYRPLTLSFLKKCGGRYREGFHVGTSDQNLTDLVRDGVLTANPPAVDNIFQRSSFFIQYAPYHQELDEQSPSVSVSCEDSSVVQVSAATTSATAASPSSPDRLDVFYKCNPTTRSPGVTTCTMALSFALFEGVSLSWEKRCGGPRKDVTIQSDLETHPYVLTQGAASADWDEVNPVVVLPPEEDRSTFTVSLAPLRQMHANQGAPVPLVLHSPVVKVSRPDVLTANVAGALAYGANLTEKSSDVDVVIEYRCRSSGESRVEVTLPIGLNASNAAFEPLVFAFTKKCSVIRFWQQWYVVLILTLIACMTCASCTSLCILATHKRGEQQQQQQGGGDRYVRDELDESQPDDVDIDVESQEIDDFSSPPSASGLSASGGPPSRQSPPRGTAPHLHAEMTPERGPFAALGVRERDDATVGGTYMRGREMGMGMPPPSSSGMLLQQGMERRLLPDTRDSGVGDSRGGRPAYR